MKTTRLEAFSDAVLAIIITIMVLEFKSPEEPTFEALKGLSSVAVSYVVSFIYLGIYWNNHHHLFKQTEKVTSGILWANLHLLFWLSLIPFATSWMGEYHFGAAPMAIYGFVLLMSAFAFTILQNVIVKAHQYDCILKIRKGTTLKEVVSIILYIIGIILSFYNHIMAMICYILVALLWIVPDEQVEKQKIFNQD